MNKDVGLLEDPDAVDGQKERCSFNNVWLTKFIFSI